MKRKIRGATVVAFPEVAKGGSKKASPPGSTAIEVQELLTAYGNYLEKAQGLAQRTCESVAQTTPLKDKHNRVFNHGDW